MSIEKKNFLTEIYEKKNFFFAIFCFGDHSLIEENNLPELVL